VHAWVSFAGRFFFFFLLLLSVLRRQRGWQTGCIYDVIDGWHGNCWKEKLFVMDVSKKGQPNIKQRNEGLEKRKGGSSNAAGMIEQLERHNDAREKIQSKSEGQATSAENRACKRKRQQKNQKMGGRGSREGKKRGGDAMNRQRAK
jgi:hypothetical protein